MRETNTELQALQQLLDSSRARASEHLRGIINEHRMLSAANVVGLLSGMKVISLATVTAGGQPRISAVDGHFLHGTWTWSTSSTSVKARHLQERPAVSVAHVDNEELALFAHGQSERLRLSDPLWEETLAHWTAHYGGSPLDWGDTRLYRLVPSWMVGYAFERERTLQNRGLGGG
jgi:general stress protein 26